MKTFLLFAVLSVINASQECLYCKRADSRAGFLYSYSYCSIPATETETCTPDSWNLIQTRINCPSGFKQGWELDIDEDCNVQEEAGVCGDKFVSSDVFVGTYTNFTTTLKDNSKCTIYIDATEEVARVIFDNDEDLGVLWPDYVIGTPITIEKGTREEIVVYNGNSAGYLNFRVSFSGALPLIMTVASSLSLLIYNF